MSSSDNSVPDQAVSDGIRSALRSSGCQTCYRIVVGLRNIATIDCSTTSTATYMASFLLYSRHLNLHMRHSLRLAMVIPQLTLVSYSLCKASTLVALIIELSG